MSRETYLRAASAVPSEVDDVELRVAEGALPPSLRGVLFRNGPGTNESWGTPYEHPFDCDGHVVRFAFDGTRVLYRNRFVDARAGAQGAGAAAALPQLRDEPAWRPPTQPPPARVQERGEHERPRSGHARDDRPRALRRAPAQRGLADRLGPKPALVLHRASRDGTLDEPVHLPMDRLVFLHDFALTPRWRIFFLVPVAFRVARTLVGIGPPADALDSVDRQPTRILLVPRAGGAPRSVEASPCFVFHFTSPHEQPDGRVVVVVGPRMPSSPTTAQTRALFEGRASIRSGSGGASDDGDSLLKHVQRFDLDLDGGRAVTRDFAPDPPGEAVSVPDANREEVLVYRAREHPPGFHDTWVPEENR